MDIFPDIVWQNILDRLNKSEDIQAVFAAFPSLNEEPRLQRRKSFWLFEEVILILATWKNLLGIKDLLKCRLVCRRWSSAVDKILVEDLHPDIYRDPLKSRNICYWEDNDKFNSIWNLRKSWFENRFYSTDCIERFMALMVNNSGDRNPFISRSASFSLNDELLDIVCREHGLQCQQLENPLIYLLWKFGEHLFYFKLDINVRSHSEAEIFRFVRECLWHLPNLKCLTVKGNVRVNRNQDDVELPEGIHLPRPPFLEKLKLDVGKQNENDLYYNYHREIVQRGLMKSLTHHILASTYTQRVERMSIGLTDEGNYPIYLNLKELEVTKEAGTYVQYAYYDPESKEVMDCWYSIYGIKDFLPYHAPHLTSLKLRTRPGYTGIIEWIITRILMKLPDLKYLEIVNKVHLREIGNVSQIRGRVKSLKYLKIEDNANLKYEFLLSFPSLRHLIICRGYQYEMAGYRKSRAVANGKMKIRDQINNGLIYQSNVWRLLPELRRVTLIYLRFGVNRVRTFTRDVGGFKVKDKWKPKWNRMQKEVNLEEWNKMVENNGDQYEEGVGSILEDRMSVSVQNRFGLLDVE